MDDQQRHHKGHFNNNNTTMMASSSSSPAATSSRMMMEKPPPGQDQLQQQQLNQQALKCPRCDSSNTKFCYYNNYSLSQPRHFCKACKRYWTRGGTLRNVPVGGGCRKNKRIKRPGTTSSSSAAAAADGGGPSSSSTSSVPTGTNNSSNPNILSSQQSDHQMNPIFYGLPNNPFMDSSTSNNSTPASGFDFHQLAGLGFDNYRNRFSNSSLPSSNFNPIFSTSQSAPTTMASVLASKFINGGGGPAHRNNNSSQYFQNLLPFEDLQIAAGNHGGGNGGTGAKDVKVEDHNHHHHHHHHHQGGQTQNRLEWSTSTNINNNSNNIHVNVNEQMGMGMSDPTIYWSSTNLGSNWHDPANLGSSVSSLI